MTDAERIWLEPECCAEPGVGRAWCSVNEWTCCPAGECDAPKPTEYVRADLVASREAAAAEAMREAAAQYLFTLSASSPRWGSPEEHGEHIRALPIPAADALARAIEDERLNPWKAAVINAMLCFEDLPREDETPREALNRHIAREQEVALDPAVSQAARDLLDQARAEEREVCAEIARAAGAPAVVALIRRNTPAAIRARGKEPPRRRARAMRRADEMTARQMVPFALLYHGVTLLILAMISATASVGALMMCVALAGCSWLAGGQIATIGAALREEDEEAARDE